MTDRKFYKTVIKVTVISENPLDGKEPLRSIAFAIHEGECSGKVERSVTKELNGKQVVTALGNQGSEPGFFNLDNKGNDVDGFKDIKADAYKGDNE